MDNREERLENLTDEKKLQIIRKLSKKEISAKELNEKLGLKNYEILSYISILEKRGISIIRKTKDDGMYFFNQGESKKIDEDNLQIKTDENNEFKFVAISNLEFGSKAQQLTILNDILLKAHQNGYNNVIICGSITAGLYPINNKFADSLFLDDSQRQVDYIVENFPKIENMKIYFVTGKNDDKHTSINKINVGKRISEARNDMIYLGDGNRIVEIDNAKLFIYNTVLSKTYTMSYRPQQEIDSFRSEDKPDIMLCGGLLQMEKFNYRKVNCLSVPSVCATTEEMESKRYSNTVGAWYVTVKTDEKGNLEKFDALDSVYYKTKKDDYKDAKILTIENDLIKKSTSTESNNNDLAYVNKILKYIRNNESVEEFMNKFHFNQHELNGTLELCKMYNKNVSIVLNNDGTPVFKKELSRKVISNIQKKDISELRHKLILVVSDTHYGNIHQQNHLCNYLYEEAYKRGCDTAYHCGDICDGNYTNRLEQPRQQFLHGFDEQVQYIIHNYPKVKGLTTYYILGSHDETHYKNDQATLSTWISEKREDMIYCGQDNGIINLNGIKIVLDHPGGGCAQALSYKLQKRIEILESGYKPNILLVGHYHKSYSCVYRNVHGILVPALCGKTQFQQKQGLINNVGGYFLDIYYDDKGNIQYLEPEEILFDKKDMWDEAGRDRKKVKQLVIN